LKFYHKMKKIACPYCTLGQIDVLINYADFHFRGDEPIYETESCEECGGSGKLIEEEEVNNAVER